MKKIILATLFICLILVIGIVGWATYSVSSVSKSIYEEIDDHPETKDLDFDQMNSTPFNVLLLGIDTGDFGRTDMGRSDSMIVARVDLAKNVHTLMSIERDILVDIADEGVADKLNAAYVYGGASCAVKTTEQFLDITIPYYISVDMEGFQQILATLANIEVENEFEFVADGFSFPQGQLTLTPEEALAWSRMRYDDSRGDYGRQMRQQLVLKAIVKQLGELDQVKNWPSFMDIVVDSVKTNLPIQTMLFHAKDLLDDPMIHSDQILGEELIKDGVSYQTVTEEERTRVREILSEEEEF